MKNKWKLLSSCIVVISLFAVELPAAAQSRAYDFGSPGTYWVPSRMVPLAGILICLHGFGLNARAYRDFAKVMAARGYLCFAPDIRGFGYWHESGWHPDLDLALSVEDVKTVVEAAKLRYPKTPLFIVGESMGGAIGLTVAAKYPEGIDGLVASVPASERFKQKQSSVAVAVRYLVDADKEFDVSKKVIDRAVSDDDLKRMWLEDPRNRISVSPRELLHFEKFMSAAMSKAKEIDRTPVLIIQGCRDNLVKPTATIKLYDTLPNPDKHMLMVGEAEHLIFQKGQFTKQTIAMLCGWLKEHDLILSTKTISQQLEEK